MAKKRLFGEGLGLSIVKEGRLVYESASRGLSGFLEAIDRGRTMLEGASVADRVVGKAAALLCVYVRAEEVYAVTLSMEARAVLERHAIRGEWGLLVDNILNVNRVGLCPFELMVAGISSPRVAYERLRVSCGRLQRESRK